MAEKKVAEDFQEGEGRKYFGFALFIVGFATIVEYLTDAPTLFTPLAAGLLMGLGIAYMSKKKV